MAVSESYPELKANQNFSELQQELQKHQLLNKVWIPNDGESLQY